MKRTAYFNQTRPTETQLGWTETSKINAILDRGRSFAQFGIVSGFTITINGGDPTNIDIAAGEGYSGGNFYLNGYKGSGSGERIYAVAANTNVGLANDGLGVDNYVTLMYAETASNPLSERTFPFSAHNTIYNESYSVQVYELAAWNAADKNDHILLGIVKGRGGGALTTSDITQFTQPKTHPSPTQPTTISGTTIVGVGGTTPYGTGTLSYTAGTKSFTWQAPSDGAPGVAQPVSSSGQVTVESVTTAYYLVLDITFADLPAVDATATITVRALYGRDIPMASATDVAHRDMVGNGVVSPTNPHGLSIFDVTGGGTESNDVLHVNGIVREAASTQLTGTIVANTIIVTNLGGQSNSFLIDGTIYQVLNGYTAGTNGVVTFTALTVPNEGDYLIYVDGDANLGYVRLAGFTSTGAADYDVLDASGMFVYDMANITAGTCYIEYDSITQRLRYKAQGDSYGSWLKIAKDITGNFSGTHKLFSSNTNNWIIVSVDSSFSPGASWGAGAVGVEKSFATSMSSATHSEELILKLGIFTWNTTGNVFVIGSNRDIRQWCTADVRPAFAEEHDSSGYHTKPLRNQFRVMAPTDGAILGFANTTALFGSAAAGAVWGVAGNSYGGYFSAATKWGLAATAPNTAMYGFATNAYAGYYVASSTALFAKATAGLAGKFEAASVGINASVANNEAILAYAQNTAGYFYAAVDYGLTASAVGTYAGYFKAATLGVYGYAGIKGVAGYATASYGGSFAAGAATGLYAVAPDQAIYGIATNSVDGVIYGEKIYATNTKAAQSAVALYCSAGVAGGAAGATGVYGTGAYGVYGEGGNGVYGTGAINGVFGSGATGAAGVGNIGVYASGALTAIHALGVLRYDVGTVAVPAGGVFYLPIVVTNADMALATYALAVTAAA